MLGRTKYASITRAYNDLPDAERAVVDTGAQVAAQAGWTVTLVQIAKNLVLIPAGVGAAILIASGAVFFLKFLFHR